MGLLRHFRKSCNASWTIRRAGRHCDERSLDWNLSNARARAAPRSKAWEEMMPRYVLNYAGLMAELQHKPITEVREELFSRLPDLWCDSYCEMSGSSRDICSIPQETFIYLFDVVNERVVVAYGVSETNTEARDASRMAGWLGKISDRFKGRADKGHIMSHKQGGGMDINLFPQRTDVNRGRSMQGRVYRELERYCASNPDTFCFSRLIYPDQSWIPDEIEYGVLYSSTRFRVERFTNAET
jgi:hypothetical protein